jgi:hypothetical protein
VRMKYQDLRAAARDSDTRAAGAFIGPRPRGTHREAAGYRAMQDLFPAVYGINAYGLEPGASQHDKALAWQLKAYLAMFDQVMAHAAAQLAHLRELFSVEKGARRSYWWQMLDDRAIPGVVHELYTVPAEQIEQQVYRPLDDWRERQGRLMDYLLSLHGENYPQNTLRQFSSGYTPDELAAVLLENKAAVLNEITAFSRDRAGAADDSRPAWDEPANISGLQRRVGLLLGFTQTHTRSLVAPLLERGREMLSRRQWREREGAQAGHHAQRPDGLHRLALADAGRLSAAQLDAGLARVQPLQSPELNEALLRTAAFADRYWTAPHGGGGRHLYTGPDESGAFWLLGEFDDEPAAARAATALRTLMLRINEQSQGLFVLEHLLLRPVGSSAAHQRLRDDGLLADSALDMRLTVVLPLWPVRCQEPNFRALAAETVHLNAPAHLQASCLWLDFEEMRHFELCLRKWLEDRSAWCAGTDDERTRMRMNHAACEVLRIVLARRDGEVA